MAKSSGKIISEIGKEVGTLAGKLTYELVSLGFTLREAEEHVDHTREGIEYKIGCKVCEA